MGGSRCDTVLFISRVQLSLPHPVRDHEHLVGARHSDRADALRVRWRAIRACSGSFPLLGCCRQSPPVARGCHCRCWQAQPSRYFLAQVSSRTKCALVSLLLLKLPLLKCSFLRAGTSPMALEWAHMYISVSGMGRIMCSWVKAQGPSTVCRSKDKSSWLAFCSISLLSLPWHVLLPTGLCSRTLVSLAFNPYSRNDPFWNQCESTQILILRASTVDSCFKLFK